MFKILTIINLFIFLPIWALLPIEIDAEAAILINGHSGEILMEKNSHQNFFPASITKIATALYALQVADDQLDTFIEADNDTVVSLSQEAKKQGNYSMPAWWLEPGSSHIGIKKGEKLTLRDLLYGSLVASGNDASNVIAKYVGGTIPQFMSELNSYLRSLGMHNTTFVNPHGLHHPDHKTTAYDMSLLAKEALQHPIFCTIVGSTKYLRPKTNKQEPTTLVQTNELIRPGRKLYYSKAIGVKTGFTALAQHNLVAAAKDKERLLIAVLLKNKDRAKMFADAKRLFETAFNQPKVQRKLLIQGPQAYETQLKEAKKPIKTFAAKSVEIEYYPAEEPKLRCFLSWDPLKLPIEKGEKVATIRFFNGDKMIEEQSLFALENVSQEGTSWTFIAAIIIVLLLLFLIFLKALHLL